MTLLAISWAILFAFLMYQTLLLKKQINLLPEVEFLSFNTHPLNHLNMSQFLRLETPIDRKTTVMLTSPSCKVCHEELDAIVRKEKHLKHEMLFFADAILEEEFTQFANTYQHHFEIKPLFLEQLEQLGTTTYPLYIDLNKEGEVHKIYRN
ncbi:hypothetical protein [Pseudalkalibacillus hwajinpoensis]|uniref:Uncharacterized protein n=1 Tax=Guptibacillus hwajinpoensis TaxID=208199 RepID=A0A4V5PZ22_9BACL|nr:hypothetical protein [Pseudalkalibacillus hwajinpoensis]TKD72288.1 hypothetical protein FBF83_05725 [Pseudalkalibacillus hwajinpoensis]